MMKRKLALLLSVVMILLAIPVSAQSSDNRLTRSSMNLPNYTLLFESGLYNGSGRVTGNAGTLEAWVDGSDFVIEVKHTIPEGLVGGNGMFRVGLDNARFFFRNTSASTGATLSGASNPGENWGAPTLAALRAGYPQLVSEAGGTYTAQHGQDTRDFSGTFEGAAANPTTTYRHANGAYANNRYLRFGRDIMVGSNAQREVAYVMEISMADETSATIILLEDANPGDRIIIPIVSRTTETGEDVHVTVEGGATSIQSGRFMLASSRGGRTSTRALGVRASRTDFDLREIVISELRMGSIRDGAGFELVAPPGFYFGNLNNINVHVEPGLSWEGGRTGTGVQGGGGSGGGGGGGTGPTVGATAAGIKAGFNVATGIIADVNNAFEVNISAATGFVIEAVGSRWVAWVPVGDSRPINLATIDWHGPGAMPTGTVTIHARAFAANPITTSGSTVTVTGTAIASEELGTIADFDTISGGSGGGTTPPPPPTITGTVTAQGTAAGFEYATGAIADVREAFTATVQGDATHVIVKAVGSEWAHLFTWAQAGTAIDLTAITWEGEDGEPTGDVTIRAIAYDGAPTIATDPGTGAITGITGGTELADVSLGTIDDIDVLFNKGGLSSQLNATRSSAISRSSSIVSLSSGADYSVNYRERAGREDRGTIQFNMTNLRYSTRMPGRIIITGATLIAEDPDRMPVQDREISLTIRNLPSGTSYTEESFVVGRMSDYIVTLTRRGDNIPELISGRLDSHIVRTGSVSDAVYTITDENHRAADVRVEEAITNAWWAARATEFRLPEGVRILRARFLNLTHLDSDSVTTLTNNPRSGNPVDFFNTGIRENNSILVRDNVLTISRLGVTTSGTNNRARFDLRLWLNIDVGFEGDIDLSLAGSSMIPESANQSVTIARAIRPIEVHTRVSDIRVGYQFVSVADFDIVENVPGALRHGETVYISVTDEISVDMNIAPGFRTNVSDGNIRISDVMLRSALGSTGQVIEGQLRFDIERESTEASTISFTDVQVKVSHTVPFSNIGLHSQRGINLVVWGPAVAANFEGLISGIRNASAFPSGGVLQTRDFFPTPGIRANYINVITPAPGGINEFINEVRASIGNPVILVNGNQYTMPVAPYVSPVSNSTMVPVRFISLALGLPETAVRWDPTNSTVTVDAGNRIVQFQTGSYHYTVNGVAMPMTSPDGLPVTLEIREERAFVPFRALGEAFGIAVTWDQESTTAIFNERR